MNGNGSAGDDKLLLECLQTLGQATDAAFVQFVPDDDTPTEPVLWSAGTPAGTLPDRSLVADVRRRAAGSSHQEEQAPETWSTAKLDVAMVAVVGDGGDVLGGLVAGRQPPNPWSATDLQTLRLFANLVRRAVTHDTERLEPVQRKLDDLVTRLATELMSVSAATLREGHQRTVRVLSEFFGVDTSFFRRNDHALGASILVAEWPIRENVPDPDPLGIVPFEGSDPVFAAIRDLREPFIARPGDSQDDYQERVRKGGGIPEVSLAMVPILHNDITEGVLGFINFGDRAWTRNELNALQTIASLLAQLQGRVDAEERLHYHAYHDELTGLPNRRALIELLHERLHSPSTPPFPLFFIDLDRLKTLNDYLGHAAGDRMLVAIADRLRLVLESRGFVARLGGDEFVIVLNGPMSADETTAIATGLLEVIARPLAVGDQGITRSACIGIAVGTPGTTLAEELVRDADVAMLAAKSSGGNEVLLFTESMREKIEGLADIELHLRSAITDGAFRLFFQPEYDLRTGRMLSVEALVRWQHPSRGLLTPVHFIEVAEESNIIVDLGRWVLEEACSYLAQWKKEFLDLDLLLRVNASPVQLISRDILDLVTSTLARHSLTGKSLCLEITERGVMRDVEKALTILGEVRKLGVTIAIDDFGTGTSSLGKLKALPVDTLKIDQSFVADLGINPGDRAIVESIVALAETFHLEVVAEGVETTVAVEELLSLGCHRAQGFLLQRPIPAPEFQEFLRHPHLEGAVPWRVT